MLSTLGDLYLAGGPIRGRFEGCRSGHKLNHRLLRALFQRADAWEWSDESAAPAIPETQRKARAGA
jgi:UDP-3-O-[3-hydroxymyristoyl] N-acetylglucosamine deacetylase